MANLCIEKLKAAFEGPDGKPTIGEARLAEYAMKVEDGAAAYAKHNPQNTMDGNYNLAINDLIKRLQAREAVAKHQQLLNYMARAKNEEYLERVKGKFPRISRAIEGLIVSVHSSAQGARKSVANLQNAKKDFYTGELHNALAKADLWDIYKDGVIDKEIFVEAFRKAKGESIRHPQARQIAEIIQQINEIARKDANSAGASIGSLPEYLVRQSHDMHRIRDAGFETWSEVIGRNLDWKRMELEQGRVIDPIKGREEYLWEAYKGLSTGVHLKKVGSGEGFVGPKNVGKELSHERTFHFKDGEAAHDYHSQFGIGALAEGVESSHARLADATGLMKVFGPNPEFNYNDLFKRAMNSVDGTPEATRLQEDRTWLDDRWAQIDGSTRVPGNAMLAKIGSSVRAIQSMAKLGGALLSSITDLGTYASEIRYQGGSVLHAMGTLLDGFGVTMSREDRMAMLKSVGIALDSYRGDLTSRLDFETNQPGLMTRALGKFFMINGLTPWTDRMRTSAAIGEASWLAENSGRTWGALDPKLSNVLKQYDITEKQWDLLRTHAVEERNGYRLMTSEGVQNIPDNLITNRERAALDDNIRSFFLDRVDHAVIRPDARTGAVLRSGTRPGTATGELMRLVTQFQSFPVAMVQKTILRDINGAAEGTAKSSIALGLARTMVEMSVLGYAALSLKALAKGREPPSLEDIGTYRDAVLQGGGLGYFGDYLVGEASNLTSENISKKLLGPTLGAAVDAMEIFAKARQGEDAAGDALRWLVNNTPGGNLLGVRMALDYGFIYALQEQLNPGYIKRMERRLEEERGVTWYLHPSSAL